MQSNNVQWAELAKQLLVPSLLTVTGVFTSWTATEVKSMRQEIQILAIQVAKLQVELAMHRESEQNR